MKKTLLIFLFAIVHFTANAQPGTIQAALDLDGFDDEIRVPAALDLLSGSSGITISSWAYLRNTAPAYPNFDGIIGFRNDASADFYILQLSANQVEARFRNSTDITPFTINHTGDFSLNTWQHFALSYDGTKLRLYINGNKVDSLDANGFLSETSGDLMAGFLYFNPTVNYALDGLIDEVGLWNRALSDAEISCIYTTQIPMQSEGLLVHLSMNDGQPDANNTLLTELSNSAGVPNATFSGLALDGNGSNFSAGINNFSNETAAFCGTAIPWNGYELTEAGIYYFAVDVAGTCDSLISITLEENSFNTNVNQAGNTLISLQNGAAYQWINCETSQAVTGANQQTFTTTANGSYAVVLSVGACSDTSSCITINSLGIENSTSNDFSIAPNPATHSIQIQFSKETSGNLMLYSLSGKLIDSKSFFGKTANLERPAICSPGLYLLGIENKGLIQFRKLIFE
jgi:hypothetical protein